MSKSLAKLRLSHSSHECAKLSAFVLYVPHVPTTFLTCALVLRACVPSCLCFLRALIFLRGLHACLFYVAYFFTCLYMPSFFDVSYVPSFFDVPYVSYVPSSFLHAFRYFHFFKCFQVLTCLTCLHIFI